MGSATAMLDLTHCSPPGIAGDVVGCSERDEHFRTLRELLVAYLEQEVWSSRRGRMTVPEACRRLGISSRCLRALFQAAGYPSPGAHLRNCRLEWVREALIANPFRRSPVKSAALRFGFRHLGRFAEDYRVRFGELPSETVARAATSRLRRVTRSFAAAESQGG